MKKFLLLCGIILSLGLGSCSTVGTLPKEKLESMYEQRVKKTSIFNKMFFNDHKKKPIIYENVAIYFDEKAVGQPFETIMFGSYAPLTIPLLRPEKRSLEHNLLYKAARTAYKNGGDAVIIDSKNDFRVIKLK